VVAASSRLLLARLNYTSRIPCNGVEEPKSTESQGLGIQLALESADGLRVGFASEAGDLSPAGVERVLERACRSAVPDPQFHGLPRPGPGAPTLVDYHDPALFALTDEGLVEAGWTVLDGVLRAFLASGRLAELAGSVAWRGAARGEPSGYGDPAERSEAWRGAARGEPSGYGDPAERSEASLRALGLIVGGDVSVIQDRVAVASTHLPRARTDESARLTVFVTAMVEAGRAKGSGAAAVTRLDHLTGEAGQDAALAAVGALDGRRVAGGEYTVIFGPQPVADVLSNLVLPACRAQAFYARTTPFLGRLGHAVAAPALSVYDDAARPGLPGSRGITCEGWPTGRTDLIRDGVLAGTLATWYDAQRLLHDPALADKLGRDGAEAERALVPRHGFRFSAEGTRAFDRRAAATASNVVVEARGGVSLPDLCRAVGHGLYVGRIWYTYPINGLAAGDFTCTVVGDSFIIRDGRLAEPLMPNCVRLHDTVTRWLQHVVGATDASRPALVWAAEEMIYAPALAVTGVRVEAIGHDREGSD
jgi:PmbA protein